MAAAQGLYAQTITDITNTSTTVWVDVAEIPAASFNASTKYLIIANAFVEGSSASNEVEVRLVSGPDGSEVVLTDGIGRRDVQGGASGYVFSWARRFDQPGTTEQIKLQAKVFAAATITVHMSQIFALNLDDVGVENTDWYYNEVTVDDASVSTTYEDGASVTIVGNSTDTWLVLGDITRQTPATTSDEFLRLNLDGALEPELNIEGDDTTNDRNQYLLSRAYVPDSSSPAKVQYRNEAGSAGTVLSTRVFAMNLARFEQFFNEYTSGSSGSIQTNFVTVASESITPTTTGNWFYIGGFGHDVAATTDNLSIRLQDDNGGSLASDPNYGDDEPGVWAGDDTNIGWFPIFKMKSLTSGGSRTINLDAKDSVNASTARQRSLVGFSLELAGGGVSVTGLTSAGQFGTVSITVGNVNVNASGLASAGSYGTPTATPGGVTASAGGLGSAQQFGTPTAGSGSSNVNPTGLGSAQSFGTPSISPGITSVPITALGSAAQFGSLSAQGGDPSTFTPAVHGGKHK